MRDGAGNLREFRNVILIYRASRIRERGAIVPPLVTEHVAKPPDPTTLGKRERLLALNCHRASPAAVGGCLALC